MPTLSQTLIGLISARSRLLLLLLLLFISSVNSGAQEESLLPAPLLLTSETSTPGEASARMERLQAIQQRLRHLSNVSLTDANQQEQVKTFVENIEKAGGNICLLFPQYDACPAAG